MWPSGSIFRSTFLSTVQLLIFPLRVSAKSIYHHKYLRYCACFHSTFSTRWPNGSIFPQQQLFCAIFLTKIKLHSTSLNSTQLTQQGGQTARFFPRFFVEKKSSENSSRLNAFGQGLSEVLLSFSVADQIWVILIIILNTIPHRK